MKSLQHMKNKTKYSAPDAFWGEMLGAWRLCDPSYDGQNDDYNPDDNFDW